MFFKLINLIKLNMIYKKKFFKVFVKKNELSLIKIFTRLNIIKFSKKKDNYLVIFLNYNFQKPTFSIENMYKKSNLKSIQLSNLRKLNKLKSCYIISSNIGLITNKNALKKLIGGLLVCKINFYKN